ncbi:M48 family metalloprotease [Streptomyces sp. AB3(2024)]|uniref:M48 family metalloprotease n=1 Tax=Streptomyces sp. AB3(2024) TaxID=3317321 RepID=UPI0035A2F394
MADEPLPLRTEPQARAIPAGTTMRFVLLVVLMLASSSSMLPTALTAAGLNDGPQCLLAAGVATGRTPPAEVLHSAAYRACIAEHGPVPWWVAPTVPVALLLLACGLFFALPAWRSRRSRAVPLAVVDHDSRILRQLEQLAQVAGLKRVPRVVVDPFAASTGAAVFGSDRRPIVRLHGGLLTRRSSAPEDFEAVLLHELAHIRNGDVTLTYATVALWRTFIAAVLVPYAVGFGILVFNAYAPESPPYEISLPAWRALVLPLLMTVVIYLARSDVLRSRELHADLTAARWGANPRIWGAVAPAPPVGVLPRALRSFTELWHTHPRWDLRREALADSTAMFEVPALLMFLTGTAAALVNSQLWHFVAHAGLASRWAWNLTIALLPATLVTGVAGTALWRSVVHRLLTARPRLNGARAGLWLGVGMAVGELFGNRIAVDRLLPGEPVMVVPVVLVGLAFAWWVTQCSHLWFTVRRGRAIHPPMALVLAGACLALCAWFWWWQDFGVIIANIPGLLTNPLGPGTEGLPVDPAGQYDAILNATARAVPLLGTTVAVPLALPAVAVLWVVPLTAWAVRRVPPGRVPSAVPGIGGSAVPAEPLPALRRALLAGMLGGVLCWAAVAGVKAHMHGWQPPVRLRGIAAPLLFQTGACAALLAGAAVAALVAGLLVDRYRLIAALVAAHAAALAGYGGVWVLSASDGCIGAISTFTTACDWRPVAVWQAFQYLLGIVLVLVTVVGIASAAVASVARRALRRGTRPAAPARAGKEPRGPVLRRSVVGVLCAGAIGVPTALLSLPGPPETGVAASSVKPAAHPRFAAQEASGQADAWYGLGGRALVVRYNTVLEQLRTLGAEATQSADGDALVASRLPSICVGFGKVARDADAFFPVPDPRVLPSWRTFTTMAAKGSRDCLDGLDRNDNDLVATGMKEINQSTAAADSINAWITASRAGRP